MASISDLQVPADLRHEPVHFHRIPRPRAQVVERDTHLPGGRDRARMRPEQIGQLAQDAEYFALLGGLRRPQLVAELDDLGRLDEDGAARRRFVVHDAADAGPRGGANRDHIAATAYGNRGVGRALALGGASSALPGTASSSSDGVTSGTGSARIVSSVIKSAASSAT